ncbi:MAG: hypothetical protein K2X98_03265 [Alphaproteobacteria bacterium]|nr:hypothetical protein [Alphaproteobacteria bacterium]
MKLLHLQLILALTTTTSFASDYLTVDQQNAEMDMAMGNTAKIISNLKSVNADNQIDACSLSKEDISDIQRILQEGIAYIKAEIKNINVEESPIRKQILTAFDKNEYKKLLTFDDYISLTTHPIYEEFLTYLEFLYNTVAYNLVDHEIREKTYQTLRLEVQMAFHWFSIQNINNIKELSQTSPFGLCILTLHSIFYEMEQYFPKAYDVVKYSEKINRQAKEETNAAVTHIAIIDNRYENLLQKVTKYLVNKDAGEKIQLFHLIEQRKQISDCRDSYTYPPIINTLWKEKDKVREISQSTLSLKIKKEKIDPAKQSSPKDFPSFPEERNDADCTVTVMQETAEVISMREKALDSQPLVLSEKMLPETTAHAGENTSITTTSSEKIDTALSEEESFDDPAEAHKHHQKRKKQEAHAALAQQHNPNESFNVFTPELIDFLSTHIYKHQKTSWNLFSDTFKANGFTIKTRDIGQKGKGSARKVTFTDGRQFTIHKPDRPNDPMAYDYFNYIQSGCTNVLELSREKVEELIAQRR